jgi:hypothetical protein
LATFYPFILDANIIIENNINEYDYREIVKKNMDTYNLYEMIAFTNTYDNWKNIKDVVYNCVLVSNNENIEFDDLIPKNVLHDYNSISEVIYVNDFEYVPFYISSKTKHSNTWKILKNYFPIVSEWIDTAKHKVDLTEKEKKNLCDTIKTDISKSCFGIFYFEQGEENHIGSLIELGLLLSQSKKVFFCGDNIYKDEVLFNFDKLMNFDNIGEFNLTKIFHKVQYEISSHYSIFKDNFNYYIMPKYYIKYNP